ncbi:MAG TPA: hypothetical protein VF519_11200 [Mycobacteriales bacterium]|jgi:hypothetical protein
MKRVVLGLLAAAALAPVPASAAVRVESCGITPRIPCGVCYTDDAGVETCVVPRELL